MNDALSKLFNVNKKTILITGATGYFGRYIAEGFLEVGADVILMGRSEKLLGQVSEFKSKFGVDRAHASIVDFYDHQKLNAELENLIKSYSIDVLINNAYDLSENTGFNTEKGTIDESSYEQWFNAFHSGIHWAVSTTQIIGSQLKRKNGSIINISSMYGVVSPNPSLYKSETFFNPPTYSVMKAGIIALTKYTAAFWGEYGVRCNAVAPGPFPNVEQDTANSVIGENKFIEKLENRTLLKRTGHPKELMGTLILLASNASSYITGQTIIVDGGWTVT